MYAFFYTYNMLLMVFIFLYVAGINGTELWRCYCWHATAIMGTLGVDNIALKLCPNIIDDNIINK